MSRAIDISRSFGAPNSVKCCRSPRLLALYGPDNEYTQAAREALAQQKFEPARYRGKPVDVTYHVSINHVPVKKVKGPC